MEALNYIQLSGGKLAYSVFGEGTEYLIAFHGFDQDGNVFQNWQESFGKKYKIIAFDLPCHGRSDDFQEAIELNDLKALYSSLKAVFKVDKFDLLGFSMGARFTLSLLKLNPKVYNKVYLFAPDGFKSSVVYRLATRTVVGKFIFYKVVYSPSIFVQFLMIGRILGLYSPKFLNYLKTRWSDIVFRNRVYSTWNAVVNLPSRKPFDLDFTEDLPVQIIISIAKKDPLIPESVLRKIGTNKNIRILEMEVGHNLVRESVNEWINRNILLD